MSSLTERRWFGHPPGLTVLFLTEMWEVFSLYGMRALLVLYMTQGLGFTPAKASLVFGAFVAGSYLTPIAGGVLADRVLGPRRAVLIGAAVMAVGHFMMAFEPLFYAALAVIAVGNGLFLPSLASQINGLYRADDPAREAAYSVYYVGINLGGFLAPLVCGTLGELVGWHWGFAAAGVGMLLGLVIYAGGRHFLPDVPHPTSADRPSRRRTGRTVAKDCAILAGVLALVVVFRGAYEQVGNTVALWSSTEVRRDLGPGLTIPVTWFLSLNPLLVFVLTPLLVAQWRRRAKAGRPVEPLRSMAYGALTTALAFGGLAVSVWAAGGGEVAWWTLVGFFVVFTAGEIQLLPVGLALFGRIAPPHLAATAVSIWFSAAFLGNLFAGAIGTLYGGLGPFVFFGLLAVLALIAALGFGILQAWTARRKVDPQSRSR